MLENNLLQAEIGPDLVYPGHPFPPNLCLMLTRFPSGFRELALSRKLSMQCINFINLIVLSLKDGCEVKDALSATSDELLGKPRLTTLERLLATALSARNIYAERKITTPNPVYSIYVQKQVVLLASSPDIQFCDPDVLNWSCLMLRATTEKGTDSWRWADTKLRMTAMTDKRQDELGASFLPIMQDTLSLGH